MSDSPEQKKSPLQEITQPFIDLFHAPRALWGINLAYVLEGMVYFGMLGYLTIYCSEYIFQAIDGADEAAHYMVMVLTAGITIAMFFLGIVADKRGVRFAIIAAFVFMVIGRTVWAGGPNLFGLEPTRPSVFAGDKVDLHVTGLGARYGAKTITGAEVIANENESSDVDFVLKVDLSAGEGQVPSKSLESKLVQLQNARLVKGEDQEWTVRYGAAPVSTRLLLHSADYLSLHPGATISLDRAYVASVKKNDNGKQAEDNSATVVGGEASDSSGGEEDGGEDDDEEDEQEYEYIVRSHWLSDVGAINTFPVDLSQGAGLAPDESNESWRISLSAATIVDGEGEEWRVQYGAQPVTARLVIDSAAPPPLGPGAIVTISNGVVTKQEKDEGEDEFILKVEWPDGFSNVDVSTCQGAAEKANALVDQFTLDLAAGDGTQPAQHLVSQTVQLGSCEFVKRIDDGADETSQLWEVRYGDADVSTRLHIDDSRDAPLGGGALVALEDVEIVPDTVVPASYMLRAEWPDDFTAIDTFSCTESPYRDMVTSDEKPLKAESRPPLADETQAARDATTVTIAALRDMEDGPVNVVLRDVSVTYVRNGGYFLQADKDGPAIFVFVSPLWSGLQIVTLVGMLLVVLGYGMYQPAAYAGVRKFTTPKTAAMGFAMLYALMNLGGWLPTFAFMLRDDDYLGWGIPGVFWVYACVTLVALFATMAILSRKTVIESEAAAKEETARIKAAEQDAAEDKKSQEKDGAAAIPENAGPRRIKPHMWLFWVAGVVLFLFKGEAPWWYSWSELTQEWSTVGLASMVVWRWIFAGLIFVSPVFLSAIPAARNWIAKHPLEDPKFAFFIFALIPVQTLFTYNWLVLPPYIKRAFEGWIGEYFEIAANANPLLIFIAVPIIVALTQKAKVYNMMIVGTFVMAAPAFLLVIGAYWWTLLAYILIMTIGEAMWQPRFLQYAAEIAPEGRTGEYMGVAQLPWFLTKVLVPLLYSGKMMDKFCPAEGQQNTETMWLIFACIAMSSTVMLMLAKRWIGKDFKIKHDG